MRSPAVWARPSLPSPEDLALELALALELVQPQPLLVPPITTTRTVRVPLLLPLTWRVTVVSELPTRVFPALPVSVPVWDLLEPWATPVPWVPTVAALETPTLLALI